MTDWKPFYKIRNGIYSTTNLLYAPIINPEGTVMCMDWTTENNYHKEHCSPALIDFMFNREVTYLQKFQGYEWAPQIIDITNKKIFIEWNVETLNTLLFVHNKPVDSVCPDWKHQLSTILQDLKNAGYYKMALYPHCFFLDKSNKLKTFDFYGCVEMSDPFIERTLIEGIIGPDSGGRFDSATVNGLIDFRIFFKNTLLNHLGTIWPDNPFPELYKIYD